jgi:hypothetical protein
VAAEEGRLEPLEGKDAWTGLARDRGANRLQSLLQLASDSARPLRNPRGLAQPRYVPEDPPSVVGSCCRTRGRLGSRPATSTTSS